MLEDYNFQRPTVNPEDGLTENQKRKVYSDAFHLKRNKAYRTVRDHLIEVYGNYLAREAKDMEQLNFGRANINAIEKFDEIINKLASVHEASNKTEDYDPSELI